MRTVLASPRSMDSCWISEKRRENAIPKDEGAQNQSPGFYHASRAPPPQVCGSVAANSNVRENFLGESALRVKLRIVPLAIYIIADEPTQGAAREDIAGKMLIGRQARSHDRSRVAVDDRLQPPFARI